MSHHIQQDQLSVLGLIASQIYELNERLGLSAGPSSTSATRYLYVPAVSTPTTVRSVDAIPAHLDHRSITDGSSQSMKMALTKLHLLASFYQIYDILNSLAAEVEAVARFVMVAVLIVLRKHLVALLQIIFIRRMMRVLPRALSSMLQDSIRFEDALGRIHNLQYQQFRNWSIFEAMVKCHFEGVPGNGRVLRRQYVLRSPRISQERLVAANWDRQVIPGMTVVMAINVKEYENRSESCPRCSSSNISSWPATGSRCFPCGLVFSRGSTAEKTSVADITKSGTSSGHVKERQNDGRSRSTGSAEATDSNAANSDDESTESEDEIENLKVFKRVNLLQKFELPATANVTDIRGNADDNPELRGRYRKRPDAKRFFRVGRVFALLCNKGTTDMNRGHVEHAEFPTNYTKLNREDSALFRPIVVVVKQCKGHSWCVPINTYSYQREAGKRHTSMHRRDHCPIYMDDTAPRISIEEDSYEYGRSIAVTAAKSGQTLHPISRIDFGVVHRVEWNLKVMNLGMVRKDDIAGFTIEWLCQVNLHTEP